MNFLLFVFYWVVGFIGSVFVCCCVGLLLAALIALFNVARFKMAWVKMVGYLACAVICAFLTESLVWLCGYVGDRTHHASQSALLIGLVFPGLFSLKIIPAYMLMASKQIKGLPVDQL